MDKSQLKYRPFKKLYRDEIDKYVEKILYHNHRAIECANKIRQIYEAVNTNNNSPSDNK